ncbi:uncharacterized protein LOC113522529 isoform X2 [Galleria mellonella]|uniref:Uncharacterized protein LOC113522529 isoform X2 n=1 Tax=Galleria mellonella TaxID=7137 RepID=A0ABM3MG13_GALME|nr:uncharacterized protein LOC113522529 isoform X2 [Galleria mellonella]
MESSEDDAGTATSASRRASAREKNVGKAEEGNATSSLLQETSEVRTSCQTPAMSEENFDGDSVPSPSSHDVNTSTEAILDMIDEFVDGPGAPKRLPHSLDANVDSESGGGSSDVPKLPETAPQDDTPQVPAEHPATSAKSEQEPQKSVIGAPVVPECTSQSDSCVSASDLKTVSVDPPQSCSSVGEGVVLAESTLSETLVKPSDNSEVSSECPPLNIPSSSVVETVQSVFDVNECQTQERIMKCVSSSDNRDNVTVESAESTSSDSKLVGVESATRSPLRRRLVRPAPSDRRPDSTVSSTVDIHTSEQIHSDHVTKDVSSSSDAVPPVHGNVKLEEIRNVSEISVCKAETSMSPPKKIKLIRQKHTPGTSYKDNIQDKQDLLHDQQQCQSTSQDNIVTAHSEPQVESLSCTSETNSQLDVNIECKDIGNNEISVQMSSSSDECSSKQEPVKSQIVTKCTSEIPLKENIESTHQNESQLDSTCISNLPECSVSKVDTTHMDVFSNSSKCDESLSEQSDLSTKQVPKITIKLGNKPSDETKSSIPKVTIKPIKPPADDASESNEQIPSITKLNIKPIPKPSDNMEDHSIRTTDSDNKVDNEEQIPLVTKINIKPIPKPPEKINDVHRKSSSSEISESENSENDESASTSDQASASDQGSSNVIPKVTIKLGKPGTQSEGKFYTEKNTPKRTVKTIQHSEKEDTESSSSVSKLKLVVTQSEEKQIEKIPKLTIKTVTKCESQPLSPKLTIKPLKPPDNINKDSPVDFSDTHQIPKLKISTESFSSSTEIKENTHVPKITIKPVTRTDIDNKILKKSTVVSNSPEHIPVVTKLNIKPILKPSENTETLEISEERVPVVSKLNIKPIVKPKDEEINCSLEDIPKIKKLNIKPLKIPEGSSSDEKICDDLNAVIDESNIPMVTKLNIKPIVKPLDEDTIKDSENQSSETGNSSDENTDHIPVITKLNIKPIVKPNDLEEIARSKSSNDEIIPVVTKLNIKPLVKPEESTSPLSPKKDSLKASTSPLSPKKDAFKTDVRSSTIPVITKLNIKPVMKPEDLELQKLRDENLDKLVKNPPLLMKINMKVVADPSSSDTTNIDKKINNIDDSSEHTYNNIAESVPIVKKLNIKPVVKIETNEIEETPMDNLEVDKLDNKVDDDEIRIVKKDVKENTSLENSLEHNCVPEKEGKNVIDQCKVLHNEQPTSRITTEVTQAGISEGSISTEVAPLSLELTNVVNSISKHSSVENLKSNIPVTIQKSETDDLSKVVNKTVKDNATEMPNTEITSFKNKQQFPSVQNCTLLKKLLESTDDSLDKRLEEPLQSNYSSAPSVVCKDTVNCEQVDCDVNTELNSNISHNMTENRTSPSSELISDNSDNVGAIKIRSIQDLCKEANDDLKNPLEINVSEKIISQSSGQDSPRIILKINKTDHGPSAKIVTEDIVSRSETIQQQNYSSDNTQENINDKQSPKKNIVNSRRKQTLEVSQSAPMGKRLRSSRVVENMDKTTIVRRNVGKRPSTTDSSPPLNKEPELSVLETKRLKLGQLLSNKSLTITPVKTTQTSPTNKTLDNKQTVRTANHSLLNNENCSKNGNSKLHNILSNLQAKQMQAVPLNDINCSEKSQTSEVDSNISTGSSDVVEIGRIDNCHPDVQEMMINESFDLNIPGDDMSQDPLEMDISKSLDNANENVSIPQPLQMTPQPKKRGRPRKLPVSEGAKPVTLPTPALEERPQRSLRLSRDRPAILTKPRGGRGRGRGRGRLVRPDAVPGAEAEPEPEPVAGTVTVTVPLPAPDPEDSEPIDPTSSRIKLPRMTEALDKMPSSCSTPLSSRRRSSATDMKLFGETHELKVVLDTLPKLEEPYKSPEASSGGRGSRGRGRGSRGLRGPRGRGRGRGGGRGAMYMKETLGIYGRVCGPATTTVQLFEEETCMMDDNATPAKPSHLLDEDSQSSVKSSTNESSKMKKSKFADLFDSNKVWTAADVKEYMWPDPEKANEEPQVMMIQEQVAMFLGVKSFKRRYPELKRRTIVGDEREYVLARGLVTDALCDLGITAVDASEVLDIMLSDYPHKYEEYRSHQREKQLTNTELLVEDVKKESTEEKSEKVDVKIESKPAEKPEPPKVDPEKTRQDMAAAAIASASEWNARLNALRRPACADLQSLAVQRRRPPPAAPPVVRVRPPAGFYPHALLPGQYQHSYRVYTPDQLRYFPLNTALSAPPPPAPAAGSRAAAASSDDDGDWPERSSSDDSDSRPQPHHAHHAAKRKKLTKVKRSSQIDSKDKEKEVSVKEEAREDEETCRVCKLRLEANRKYTHERFLVCATCNSKQHAACVQLAAASARRAREYAWQCQSCKVCGVCGRPAVPSAAADTPLVCCELCDRSYHATCIGRDAPPSGRWHCSECAICKSCGARDPAGAGAAAAAGAGAGAGAEAEWHHQTRRGPGGHKLYSHSLCTPCASKSKRGHVKT